MKKNIASVFSNENLFFPLGFFVALVLLLANYVGATSFLRTGISYVAQPIYYNANIAGSFISSYVKTFVELDEFRKEYDELSTKLYEKEVENSYYSVLLEENEALKKQVNLADSKEKYVLSKVLNGSSTDSLRINKGKSSGIMVGDTVTLGNVYIGSVIESDEMSSLIRLANSKSSSLEVILLEGDWQTVTKNTKISILSRGVVSGASDGIKIENISANSAVKNGNIVVVNDSKIGETLVLGYVVNLSDNPAEISRTGFVSPVIDYDDLVTVFVRVDR
ncbi:MAG: rod shape-determining protein MreC [Candidatus Dojkabacteria bacterium]